MKRLSDDPEIVERRLWYETFSSSSLASQSSSLPHVLAKATSLREEDPALRLPLLENVEENKTEKPKMKMFTSSALDMVDEMAKKQDALSKPPEARTLMIEEYWGPLPDLKPIKWLYPLNDSAKEAFSDIRSFGKLKEGKGQRKVLFCFHGLGSNHVYFNPWAKVLHTVELKFGDHDSNIELWAVCLPGRSGRFLEANAQSVHTLAGCIGDSMATLGFLKGVGLLSGAHLESTAIGSNNDSNTICLFGHSLGALVAFETARYLKSRYAVEIPYLYLSCLPEPITICDANRDHLVTKRGDLSNDLLLKKMKEMGDSVLNRFCTSDNADNGNESDNDLNKLLQMFIPLLRADFVLLESYVMDSYLQKDDSSTLASGRNGLRQCHLTTLVCDEDSVVIGDDYKGETAQKKVVGRGILSKQKSDDKGMQIIEPKKISKEYNDTIEEWSQQLAGGTRGANYRDGCSHSHMSFPKGGHHGYLLRLENQMVIISDIVQKMNSNSNNLVVVGK